MRKIDADALKKSIPITRISSFQNCRECGLLDRNQIIDLIDASPTIDSDVYELSQLNHKDVVLCEQCKHWRRYTQVSKEFGHCRKNDCEMKFDDFCSKSELLTNMC